MKIVFVGGANIPSQGGIENYMLNIASQLQNKGNQTWIICRGDEHREYCVNNVKVTQLKCKENIFSIFILNLKASYHLYKHGKGMNVVNYQHLFLPIFYEWLPKLKRIKVVHTIHSFAQDNPKHGMIKREIINISQLISRIIFSPVITVSNYNRKLINNRLRKDAHVINCGVDLPQPINGNGLLESMGIKEGRYYLTIGRIDPVKNLDILIRAFLKHPKEQDIQLVICGNINNEYGRELKKIAAGDKRVIFTGPVSGLLKESLLHKCFAYCLVSSSEGFPIALLEAMAHKNICICTDIPACEEVLPHEMGIWCKAKDEDSLWKMMDQLERNYNNYLENGIKACTRIEKYLTWDKISDQYIEYLSKIM